MSGLSVAQAERIREAVEGTFLDLITVRRPGMVVDEEGDTEGAPTVIAVDLEATIGEPSPRARETAASLGQRLDAVLLAPLSLDLAVGDIVEHGAGRTWTVETVADVRSAKKAGLRSVE